MTNPFQEIADQLRRLQASVDELTQTAAQRALAPELTEPIGVEEAARLLRYSTQTVYDKVNENALPFHKRENRLYFFRDELVAWIRAGAQPTAEQLQQQVAQTAAANRKPRRSRKSDASQA